MRPLFGVMLVPSMPMNEERLATSGSLRMTRVRARCPLGQGVEGDALGSFRDAEDHPRVLHGEESLGYHHVEHDGEDEGANGHHEGAGWWRRTHRRVVA